MRIVKVVYVTVLCSAMLLLIHSSADGQAKITKALFGKTSDGQIVDIFTLTNKRGLEVKITNYGGIITSLKVPDRNSKPDDIVLGFDNLDAYLKGHPYFGALIGRYGNRIAKGRFTLHGRQYKLAVNNGENHLHGGIKGFDKVVWTAQPARIRDGVALKLTYISKDGEEGYPGTLRVHVIYRLMNTNELKISYSATTDKDTVINLTSHSYFNLAGQGNGDILNQQLLINATRFTPTDAGSIPTGELKIVTGTPFDFTSSKRIGDRINNDDEQLKFGNGYDHNFVLTGGLEKLKQAAIAYDPASGRLMEIWTTEPGVQFYSGNFLDGTLTGKGGKVYQRRSGFCLETQHFPDSPNQPSFPTTVLKKGEFYHSLTVHKFKTASR